MAHHCPGCGLIRHCQGDIDDLVFSDTPAELLCKHCDDQNLAEPMDEDLD